MVTHDAAVAERAPRQIVVRDGLIASDLYRRVRLGGERVAT
jgi:ABC-type lipoprotein export system ATPase subunit